MALYVEKVRAHAGNLQTSSDGSTPSCLLMLSSRQSSTIRQFFTVTRVQGVRHWSTSSNSEFERFNLVQSAQCHASLATPQLGCGQESGPSHVKGIDLLRAYVARKKR